jgi:CelD/BcsL family acetyltransferase involved in cellulose biosynthesis
MATPLADLVQADPPASPADSRSVEIEPIRDFSVRAREWDALAEAAGNLFATREWAEIWWSHFGGGHELYLQAVLDRDGALAGILPLYDFTGPPLGVMRFIGHGAADQLGPVCAPERRDTVALALRDLIERRRPRRLLLAEQLLSAEHWQAALGGRVVARTPSPVVLPVEASWQAYLATKSANFRGQVGRRRRQLERAHEAVFRLSADPETLSDDLDTLFRLHRARWAGVETAFAGRDEVFHRDFARTALARGWLRLWLLEVDGVAVAAWFGFRFAGIEWYYQAGRDPTWDDRSIGFVLFSHALEQALSDGVSEFRMLRGGESYKYRFATGDVPLESIVVGSGLVGESAAAVAAFVQMWPPARASLRPLKYVLRERIRL